MRYPRNRMARPETRDPVPLERVLVTPPPESVPKCPHCGAARINQWRALGSPHGKPRKECRACGKRVEFSEDWRRVRIIG